MLTSWLLLVYPGSGVSPLGDFKTSPRAGCLLITDFSTCNEEWLGFVCLLLRYGYVSIPHIPYKFHAYIYTINIRVLYFILDSIYVYHIVFIMFYFIILYIFLYYWYISYMILYITHITQIIPKNKFPPRDKTNKSPGVDLFFFMM